MQLSSALKISHLILSNEINSSNKIKKNIRTTVDQHVKISFWRLKCIQNNGYSNFHINDFKNVNAQLIHKLVSFCGKGKYYV